MTTASQEFISGLSPNVISDDGLLAGAIVQYAAAMAEQMRADGLSTEYKTSISDVVTAADRAAEEFVVTALAELRPDDGILGEEGSAKTSKSGRTWVIDPVDGTYNFTTHSDYWCSALALIIGQPEAPEELVLGAVHRTSSGQTWVGGPSLPTRCWAAKDSAPEILRIDDVSLNETCIATYLHSTVIGASIAEPHDGGNSDESSDVGRESGGENGGVGRDSGENGESGGGNGGGNGGVEPSQAHTVDSEDVRDTRNWLTAASRSATWRMLGSASVDTAGVADGRLGAWFQRDVAPWDWLPGRALVEGAGGVTEEVGRWKIAGAPSAVAELVEILR